MATIRSCLNENIFYVDLANLQGRIVSFQAILHLNKISDSFVLYGMPDSPHLKVRFQLCRVAAVAALAVAGLGWMNSLAPLQWPTVLVYSGLAVFVFGALSIFVPPAWSGFSRRRNGLLIGILAGGALFAAGCYWPAGSFAASAPSSRLDAFMPVYHFHERHEITIQAPPERVREALNRVSFADIGVMQTLGKIRAIAMGQSRGQANPRGAGTAVPIIEMIANPRSGFFPLDDTPREIVFGLAGQPWNNAAVRLQSGEFQQWTPPHTVKIAANFRIEDAGDGRSRVITETRVAANDDFARVKMARYWALIYPGSGMIRRSLLQVIRDRAEHR